MLILLVLFFLVLVLYAVFSYILTDPNLVLSSQPIYWNFQTYLWDHFYNNPKFISWSFAFLILMMFLGYAWVVSILKERKTEFKFDFKSKYLWIYTLLISPLVFSYNALSHDIFNYMFNAKMVLVYGANPHIRTAMEFAETDSWVRFMHNIHTYAPYGYGWTALSLIPSFLGMEKFLPTLFLFRLFMILSIVFLFFAMQHLSRTLNRRNLYLHELALVFFNPLFLLEVISNYHNDLWMMAPAVLAVSMILRLMRVNNAKNHLKKSAVYFVMASLLLIFSISIKLVTVLIAPLFILGLLVVFFLQKYSELIKSRFRFPIPTILVSKGLLFFVSWLEKLLPALLAIVLFLPLFTARSQQFLPWYLLWVLPWAPFIRSKILRNLILIFSLSAMLRYLPWLSNSFEYSNEIIFQQKMITWTIPLIYLVTNFKQTIKNTRKVVRI